MRPDGTVFWVGKGYGYRAFSRGGRNPLYKNIVAKYGEESIKTTIIPLENEEKALSEEVRLITYFRALGCRLANIAKGGEGASGVPSSRKGTKQKPLLQEHKDHIAKALRGRQTSPEHRKNLSKALTGKPGPRLGSKTSDETKKKQSDAQRGRKLPEKVKIKISKTLKGRPRLDLRGIPCPIARREKISKSLLGKQKGRPSPMLGRKQSAAARQKIAEGNKRAWAHRKEKLRL